MKIKIIIIIMAVLMLIGTSIGIVVGLKHKKEIEQRNQKRYAEIKEDIQEDIAGYVRVRRPFCSVERGENLNAIYTDDTLVNQRGMDKEKLLDVDGKSYCKVRVEVKCVGENEHTWDTYLKCKDYEDENYSNWDGSNKNWWQN